MKSQAGAAPIRPRPFETTKAFIEMELLCVCCGKPWDVAHVLREATTEFDREGALIRGCPCCHGVEPDDMTEEKRGALRIAAAAAMFLGDDVDGLIALVEDIKALG